MSELERLHQLAHWTVMNGNVGIGTWVPMTPFQVNGSYINTYISSTGNVGIGSSTPIWPLDVAGRIKSNSSFQIISGGQLIMNEFW